MASSDYFFDRRDKAMPLSHCLSSNSKVAVRTNRNRQIRTFARLSGILICFLVALNGVLLFANPVALISDDRDSDQVTSLISQLDSRDYDHRETAAQNLVEIGEQAIYPLALKSLACSPEVCWRIRKVLEQISTSGNETVFYKTAAILRLRFDSNSSEMEKRLSVLKTKWKAQRKKDAISLLRKKGAVVNDPFEGQAEVAGKKRLNHLVFPGGGLGVAIINGRAVELSSSIQNKPSKHKAERPPRKQLSDAEAKKEIERILSSSLKQARQIVIGDDDNGSELADELDPNLLDLQQKMQARHAGAKVTGQGVVAIELGDQWKGSATDLEVLSDVSKLTEVKLVSQNLGASNLMQLSSINTINRLIVENCEFEPKEIRNVKWPKSLREIELAKLELSDEIFSCIKTIPSLSLLTFRECEFGPGSGFVALKQLKDLRGLHFKGLDISADLFEFVAEMKQLSFVSLSYCKFKTTDYKTLKRLRPKLQISFTAKAFLGVRGLTGAAQDGRGTGCCVVSEVIAGSGAEKGGLKVDDVIQTINGEKIEVFEDLRLHIAQHRPGEKLAVTVNRSGESIALEIELSSSDQQP